MPTALSAAAKRIVNRLFWILVGVILAQVAGPYFVRLLPGPRVVAEIEGRRLPNGCFYYTILVGSDVALEHVTFSAQFPKQVIAYRVGTAAYQLGPGEPHASITALIMYPKNSGGRCNFNLVAYPSPNVVASMPGPGYLVVNASHFTESSIYSVVSFSEQDPDIAGVVKVSAEGYYEYRKLGQVIRTQLRFKDKGLQGRN